jgi:hypothetical protein
MIAGEVAQSAAVFEGRVVDVQFKRDSLPPNSERNPTERWLRYEELVARVVVGRRWKGVPPDTTLVHTAWQGTMCGADLVEGKRYLLFASSAEYSGLGEEAAATATTRLSTSSCSLTRPWDAEGRRLAGLLASAQRR